jgi:hypothetical protein
VLVSELRLVQMASCSLSGPVPQSLPTLLNVVEVDLSNNLLSGPVPVVWSSPGLRRLALSNNALVGPCAVATNPAPMFLSTQTQLLSLDLSNNPLNCSASSLLGGLAVAQCITALDPSNDLKVGSLATVRLANCGLYGPIPPTISAFAGALQLDMSGNDLTGDLPDLGEYRVTLPEEGVIFKSTVEFLWETVRQHGWLTFAKVDVGSAYSPPSHNVSWQCTAQIDISDNQYLTGAIPDQWADFLVHLVFLNASGTGLRADLSSRR